jgi:hypothetical protein
VPSPYLLERVMGTNHESPTVQRKGVKDLIASNKRSLMDLVRENTIPAIVVMVLMAGVGSIVTIVIKDIVVDFYHNRIVPKLNSGVFLSYFDALISQHKEQKQHSKILSHARPASGAIPLNLPPLSTIMLHAEGIDEDLQTMSEKYFSVVEMENFQIELRTKNYQGALNIMQNTYNKLAAMKGGSELDLVTTKSYWFSSIVFLARAGDIASDAEKQFIMIKAS